MRPSAHGVRMLIPGFQSRDRDVRYETEATLLRCVPNQSQRDVTYAVDDQ